MDPYTAAQKQDLIDQIDADGARPTCPRCGGSCAVIRTPPRSDVSYVRNRIVVRCSTCTSSFGFDVGGIHPR